jgi:hypothetical protein
MRVHADTAATIWMQVPGEASSGQSHQQSA